MAETSPAMTAPQNLRQRRFGLTNNSLEGRRLPDRQIGKYLAVDHDARLAQAGDETAVVEAERTHRRVEPLDPKRAKSTFAALTVAVGILLRLLDRLLGDADRVLAPAIIALGGLQHFLVLGMGGDAAFGACHEASPLGE